MRKFLITLLAAATLAGCTDADVVSSNLSKAADNFEVQRRVVFYNGITAGYILVIEGRCSLGSGTITNSLTVTCKVGPTSFKKHYLGVSDNVTYFVEQIDAVKASAYHYRVVFKPQTVMPAIDLRTSM